MKVIYEPRGRAREYAPLAVSLYRGCAHGCLYCFAPNVLHRTREDFLNALPREFVIEDLEKDLYKMMLAGDDREVLMSFTTDPYQPIEDELLLTQDAIKLFMRYGRRFSILTKAGLASTRDFSLMKRYRDRCRYGTTLTLWGPEQEHWEPFAAKTQDRIHALCIAHGMGIPTWVSMEPLINPAHSLDIIQATLPFVDEYRLGTLNHINRLDYQLPEPDLKLYLEDALVILQREKKEYIIKEDLLKAARAQGWR